MEEPTPIGDGWPPDIDSFASEVQRQHAEAAVRKSDRLYRSLFDNMLNGLAYCRLLFEDGRPQDFIYVAVNDAFESQTGLKNVVGRKASEVIPGILESDPQLLESYARAALTGQATRFETFVHALQMWFSISVYSPAPDYFVAVFDVVTERKQAEEALKASESLLRFRANLLQSVGEAVIATGLDGAILFWNKAAERIYGWKSEEVIGRNIMDVTPAEQSRGQAIEIMSALVAGRSWEGEIVVRHRDGHSFPAMVTDTAIMDDTGQLAGIIGVSSDISERRRQEDERLVAQNDLATTLDAIPDLLFEIGLNGRYYAYHSPREDLLAAPPEGLIGRTVFDVLSAEAAATCIAALWEANEQGRSTGKQFELDLPQGKHWFELSISRKPVAPGHEPRFIALSRDVTERKQAEAEREALEAQLRQAQKMESVGQLAGGIAHDFNNLITVIAGTAHLVSEQLAANDPLRDDMRAITEAADRAATMTRQLLAFSRKQIMQPKVLDLSAVVLDLEAMLRRLISEDVDLRVVAARGSDSIRADPGQIEQVVVNLAVNARDAMPTGGALTITVEAVDLDEAQAAALPPMQPGLCVTLTVSDTGTGMDEATIARLFEPFFTTKGVGEGTGLGLPTVYGIVQQSGGAIRVDSEVGRGTTFRIWFPRVAGDVQRQQAAPKVVPQRGAETILVVEDYEGLRVLARRMLKKVGYTVLVAGNGNEAMRVLEGHDGPVHLVLTDVVMPGMGGPDLAAWLKEARPEIRVIYTSGYTDDALLRQGVNSEAAQFLAKPYTLEELTRTVRTVLDAG